MTRQEFAKGIYVERFDFPKGGFCIKLGINKENFMQNIFNDKGYANFDILFSKKDGSPFCVVNSYHKTVAETTNREQTEDAEEIPF